MSNKNILLNAEKRNGFFDSVSKKDKNVPTAEENNLDKLVDDSKRNGTDRNWVSWSKSF